jgi:dihydroorotate dehydrogenase
MTNKGVIARSGDQRASGRGPTNPLSADAANPLNSRAVIYRRVLRPLLFALDPETAHVLTMSALRMLARVPFVAPMMRARLLPRDPILAVDAFGLRFPHPVGLAAGLDKNAEAIDGFAAFGFGFVEVGTVTAEAQPGNPHPRLFRLPADRAIVNRMGFNNHGAAAASERIRRITRRHMIIGINIGKTKRVENEAALDDYANSAACVAPLADYVTVNVSSPNTPGLRDLQTISALRPLLVRVRSVLDSADAKRRIPLLLKIAPDLSDEDIDAIGDLAIELQLDGIIATNTTITRANLSSDATVIAGYGQGGLSGAPLKNRSLAVLRRLRVRVGNRVTLVAAGGIESAEDAWERICAGATLIQIYTALVYEGPLLARRIALGLAERTRAAGFSSIAAAVGSKAHSA